MIHCTQCSLHWPSLSLSRWPLVFEYSNVAGLSSMLLVALLCVHTEILSSTQNTWGVFLFIFIWAVTTFSALALLLQLLVSFLVESHVLQIFSDNSLMNDESVAGTCL